MMFLVEARTRFPHTLDQGERSRIVDAERVAALSHREAGTLLHIWRVPGQLANVAVWSCQDPDELHEHLTSLPAWEWMEVSVRPLATHPLAGDDVSPQMN